MMARKKVCFPWMASLFLLILISAVLFPVFAEEPVRRMGRMDLMAACPPGFEGSISVEFMKQDTGEIVETRLEAPEYKDYVWMPVGVYIVKAWVPGNDHFTVTCPVEEVNITDMSTNSMALVLQGDPKVDEELDAIRATFEPNLPASTHPPAAEDPSQASGEESGKDGQMNRPIVWFAAAGLILAVGLALWGRKLDKEA